MLVKDIIINILGMKNFRHHIICKHSGRSQNLQQNSKQFNIKLLYQWFN